MQFAHSSLLFGKDFPDPPPRVVKIFVSSSKSDFSAERRHFHENVVPSLQRFCSSLSLDLLVIDGHWRGESDHSSNGGAVGGPFLDTSGQRAPSPSHRRYSHLFVDTSAEFVHPHQFGLQLQEIEDCHRLSLGTFFLVRLCLFPFFSFMF